MMTDLFSSLDGTSSLWSWLISILLIVSFSVNFSWIWNLSTMFLTRISTFWKGSQPLNPLKLLLSGLMLFLIFNNLIGLTPYVYGVTSSLWFNSSLALILWLLLLVSGFFTSPKQVIAHLAPSGAPMVLIPFLIIIETISILIRPLTLTVRLVANISAGHIVLSLIANVLSSSLPMSSVILLNLIMIGYMLFEVFVCFIQAYIFTLLVSLYASEHPFK
uniref:ATP synthase subunit a n=1 Tax=Deroceras reticulatum TaxID=145610 RepID=A0A343ERN4_DERRE|nr:ATP synthase F0 subunit 6 [Deroceras reticulatum]ASL05740.1 ATP synthase F0 subunit 6 [Deroceras reticulatum]